MANKQLTAKVRLNTTQAEKSIDRLVTKINKINNAVNKAGTTNKVEQQLSKSNKQVNSIANKVKTWANNQKQVNAVTKSTNGVLGSIGHKLKGIAAAYLGIMGGKAIVNTSDTITSAQNKLNYINGQQLGSAGYTADGGDYSAATINATAEDMNKMYTSAQKVGMGYNDMMSNVSKAMVLAGDAFNNNTDYAIRFQEIMAEAYAVGGASAAEMSTSMYQLIQALGAGTLAGDELRSVREGASLAYDKIEDFVQGVYKSDESLKDLASQGKVTSDMVVAAVMSMGDEMDAAFAMTEQTFAQTWTRIKNAAMKAFVPISEKLRDALNNALDNGLIEKVEIVFSVISQIVIKAIDFICIAIGWIADNWSWVSQVLLVGLAVLAAYFIYVGSVALISGIKAAIAWLILHWQMVLIIAVIAAVILAFIWLANTAASGIEFIIGALAILALAILIIGIVTGSTAMIVIAIILAVLAVIIMFLGQISGGVMATVSFIWNLLLMLFIAIVKSVLLPLIQAWDNFANFFGNLFNDPIAAIIRAFEGLADTVLSILHTIASGIDSIFGSNLASVVQGWRDGVASKADELVEKWGNGTYKEKSDATSKVESALNNAHKTLAMDNVFNSYQSGKDWGDGVKSKIGNFGESIRSIDIGSFGSLGLNTGGGFGGSSSLDTYTPPSNDDLLSGVDGINGNSGGTKDNTGSMADSMDLMEEDLEFLRELADKEWKKEYTTATITVDMSNYNTINGENDLDGIVTKLADKLYEEMNSLADGVYA